MIAQIIKGGLLPRLQRHPDGSYTLTGLPPEAVASAEHGAALGARIDALGADTDGDRD